MSHRRTCLLAALTLAAACTFKEASNDDGASASDGADGTAATLDALAFEPAELDVWKGASTDFAVVATWSDGTDADVTADCALSVADEAVAAADGGAVTGLAVDLTAQGGGASGEAAEADVMVSAAAATGGVQLLGHGVGEVEIWVAPADDSEDPWLVDASALADGSFLVDDLGVGAWRVTPRLLGNRFQPPDVELTVGADGAVSGALEFRQVGQAYPRRGDGVSNQSAATAEEVVVGEAFRTRTLWPHGEADWYAIDLALDQTVLVFTANLAASTDTRLAVYDTDGTTELDEDDDCIGYDSCVTFTAPAAGTYYARVRAYDEAYGVGQYQLAVIDHVDADGDEWGTYHDCDDDDPDVHPWALADEPTTGVDADCDRWVRPDPAEPDAIDEAGTDEASAGRIAPLLDNNAWANFYVMPYASRLTATLHDDEDVDWWSFTIPPYRYFYLDAGSSGFDRWGNTYGAVTYTLVDSDRSTTLETSNYDIDIYNDSPDAKTLYLRATLSGSAPVVYYPALTDLGEDRDGDGYYTQDWSDDRDCDDGDDSIIGGCAGAR